ncbi:TPA: phosphoglucomutase/phosphomannomutase family protein [Candidatus Scatenecus faecavium]|uniref:Phosphoglucomutase/phosphomannomutase family protein n=1 Tax=Candidatus Scatenecus faecavium TaxID=2840915 RepID=A0A9D1FVV8_9BACT|nr:phosphoglucomutase/phosphomannomutase family protein [Candidatus Scatenecus faecavium]
MATKKIEFGTDGFRGIIAGDFTFENVQKISHGIIKYLRDNLPDRKSILIGYDPRFMADEFARFCADIFVAAGYDTMLSNCVCPTPVLAYAATVAKNSAGAVMFTASHNPKNYLGMKFIPNYGGPATKQITDIIVKNIEEGYTAPFCGGGKIINSDFREVYFSHLESLIDFNTIKKANIKFIYDGLFSASIGTFDEILNRHGINYEIVNNHYDPNFGGFLPEPKEKFMHHKKNGFLTFANDGDADRYGVIDENGQWVSPNEILAILLKYLVENKNAQGKMIKTVGVSALVDVVSQKLNIETETTPVGFKWLSEKMRECPAILAGEDSGGLSTGSHIPEKDGIYANLLILEMISTLQKPLCALRSELLEFAGVNFYCDRVDVKLEDKEQMYSLQQKFLQMFDIAGMQIYDVLKIDGAKFYLGEEKLSWILMRPSGTEPLLRFYIESDSTETLDKIKEFIHSHTS